MNTLTPKFAGLIGLLLLASPLWSQADTHAQQPVPAFGLDSSADTNDDRMVTPPPVSGESYPSEPSSEERSNYLRGGVVFTAAHTDNALGSLTSNPISDVSYSVGPTLALDETTPRMHTILTYAPGFTAYQKTSSRNEVDQNAAIEFTYRLSSHLTFSARDNFQKSSNVFNQSGLATDGTVSGSTQGVNFSVIAPLANRLSNSGTLGIADQFSRDQMIGASGTFSNLHYPDPEQVPGLFDSSTQAGSAFYSLRISKVNYAGASYEYQRLLSYPEVGVNETQTHAILFFYTVYPSPRFSLSFFGGPQHSDSVENLTSETSTTVTVVSFRTWTPAAGASFSWQGKRNNLALSYLHKVSGGGGLNAAVQMDSASLSAGQQVTKTLSASLGAGYSQNNALDRQIPGLSYGHSIFGSASLQQQLGQHIGVQLGYTRLHQSYSNVAVLATAPDTNREFVSISYQFSKALGR